MDPEPTLGVIFFMAVKVISATEQVPEGRCLPTIDYEPLGYEDRGSKPEWHDHIWGASTCAFPGCPSRKTVQIDFWESEASAPGFLAARGTGKTLSGAAKTLKNVLTFGADALIIAPRYDQVRAVLVKKYLELIPKELIWCPPGAHPYHETHKTIILKNLEALAGGVDEPGATLWFRSGDEPEMIEGFTVGTVHLDEAARMAELVYQLALPCRRDPRGPGQIIMTTTPPGGRNHWVNQKWGNGHWQEGERQGFSIINPSPNCPAWNLILGDNYALSEKDRAEIMEGLDPDSPIGQQQLFGRVVDFAGLVFECFKPEMHVKTMPEDFIKVAGGIDRASLGGTTAVGLMGKMPSGRVYSFFEWGKQHCDTQDLVQILAPLVREWGHKGLLFYMDPDPQHEAEIQLLQSLGLPVVRAAKKDQMDTGIRLMWRWMRPQGDGLPGYYISPACPMTIGQYQSWSFVEGKGPGGTFSYEDGERRGKDYIDKERYEMMGLLTQTSQAGQKINWTVRGKPLYPKVGRAV